MNQKNLILAALVSCFGLINAQEDMDARLSWQKDHPVNRLDGDGNTMAHRIALDCQNDVDSPMEKYFQGSEEELSKMQLAEFFLQNPFMRNKDGKTPRQIAQEIAETTGCEDCLNVAKAYKELEDIVIEDLREQDNQG